MGTVSFSCGCSITRSMFNHKIMDFNLCVWHRYLYDEDKTIKQIVESRKSLPIIGGACYCMCHYYWRANKGTQEEYHCERCNHDVGCNGTYNLNNEGWTPTVKQSTPIKWF